LIKSSNAVGDRSAINVGATGDSGVDTWAILCGQGVSHAASNTYQLPVQCGDNVCILNNF